MSCGGRHSGPQAAAELKDRQLKFTGQFAKAARIADMA